MSDAESTIRNSILMGMTDNVGSPEKTVENIFARLFAPEALWSVTEYLEEKCSD